MLKKPQYYGVPIIKVLFPPGPLRHFPHYQSSDGVEEIVELRSGRWNRPAMILRLNSSILRSKWASSTRLREY